MFSSADNANQDSRPNVWQGSWPAIVRLIILEILLLLALAGAFVYYLNWSSQVAMSEFIAAGKAPLHAIKDRAPCRNSA
jgi:uncharacterized membrane protein